MNQNNDNKTFFLWENIILLILKVILFITLLTLLIFKAKLWLDYLALSGPLIILVMFKRLDFIEVLKIKAGTHSNIDKTDSDTSTTIEKALPK